MLLNRCAFLAAALPIFACAYAADVHCPQTLTKGGAALLDSADVFYGPPEELADLMPDEATYEWDIALDQDAAKKEGRRMYLVCRYKRSNRTVKLLIPREANLCKVEGTANGTTAAWCKASKRHEKQTTKGAHGHQS